MEPRRLTCFPPGLGTLSFLMADLCLFLLWCRDWSVCPELTAEGLSADKQASEPRMQSEWPGGANIM